MSQTDLFVEIPFEDEEPPDWIWRADKATQMFHVECSRLDTGGDINKSYSAQSASENSGAIKRPFNHKGLEYVVFGSMFNGQKGICSEAWTLTPAAQYKGPTYKYGERAHNEPHRGDHTGEKVFSGPVEYILTECHLFWCKGRNHDPDENGLIW